jgi:hypothetical protein
VSCSCMMTPSTMSSLIPSRSTFFGAVSTSDISTLVAGVGEGGGVASIAVESAEASWARFRRLLGCESGECEREVELRGEAEPEAEAEAEDEDGRPALLEAARAALVIGT